MLSITQSASPKNSRPVFIQYGDNIPKEFAQSWCDLKKRGKLHDSVAGLHFHGLLVFNWCDNPLVSESNNKEGFIWGKWMYLIPL